MGTHNMPDTADPSEIKAEVQQMHDSGIAGVEVGQGAFPNNSQLVALLPPRTNMGLKSASATVPHRIPRDTPIDGDDARKSLFLGKVVVSAGATFDGPLPAPVLTRGAAVDSAEAVAARPPEAVNRAEPLAAAAAAAVVPRGRALHSSPSSPTGARSRPVQKRDRWNSTAPRSPTLRPPSLARMPPECLAAPRRADCAGRHRSRPSACNGRCSPSGRAASLRSPIRSATKVTPTCSRVWKPASSPEVKALMKRNGGDIFYDSHSSDRGSPDELWTNRMAGEFTGKASMP